jgi:nucleoside-diphosphate-sugar epimerase
MKILLTGHEGYLGSRLAEYFTERGHEVAGWGRRDDLYTISWAALDRIRPDLVINCATAANRVDTVYQLSSPDEKVNFFGTRALVAAMRARDIGLIHLSTKDVYGEVYTANDVREEGSRLVPRFAINEDQPFRPRTIYAKTKLMAEFIAEAHPKSTIIRLSSGYTSQPHRRGNWILHFCRAAKEKRAVRINGSGKQLRDPLHADDLAALLLLIQEKEAWGLKLNAGGGMASAHSVVEVLDLIDPNRPREFCPGGDLGYITDNGLATKLLGWKPEKSFAGELRKLIAQVNRE